MIQALQQEPRSLENTLSSLGGDSPREVVLSLPRFRIEWGASSLQKCLRRLGVNLAFDGGQTINNKSEKKDILFSRMTNDPAVYLDDVIHKAVMEVTEEGTVAAAATVSVMRARSLVIPPPPLVLEFNRPFVMLVVHVPTNTPVFMARVQEPQLAF
jgi:serpin B